MAKLIKSIVFKFFFAIICKYVCVKVFLLFYDKNMEYKRLKINVYLLQNKTCKFLMFVGLV